MRRVICRWTGLTTRGPAEVGLRGPCFQKVHGSVFSRVFLLVVQRKCMHAQCQVYVVSPSSKFKVSADVLFFNLFFSVFTNLSKYLNIYQFFNDFKNRTMIRTIATLSNLKHEFLVSTEVPNFFSIDFEFLCVWVFVWMCVCVCLFECFYSVFRVCVCICVCEVPSNYFSWKV